MRNLEHRKIIDVLWRLFKVNMMKYQGVKNFTLVTGWTVYVRWNLTMQGLIEPNIRKLKIPVFRVFSFHMG